MKFYLDRGIRTCLQNALLEALAAEAQLTEFRHRHSTAYCLLATRAFSNFLSSSHSSFLSSSHSNFFFYQPLKLSQVTRAFSLEVTPAFSLAVVLTFFLYQPLKLSQFTRAFSLADTPAFSPSTLGFLSNSHCGCLSTIRSNIISTMLLGFSLPVTPQLFLYQPLKIFLRPTFHEYCMYSFFECVLPFFLNELCY
jgi:hypothetical protein